jgi:hypothetical protein
MIEIKDLLLKFNNLLVSGEVKKSLIAEVVSSVVGFQVNTEDVEVKNGSLFLNIKPIHKAEVFKKKETITLKLEDLLGKNHPKDVR